MRACVCVCVRACVRVCVGGVLTVGLFCRRSQSVDSGFSFAEDHSLFTVGLFCRRSLSVDSGFVLQKVTVC